MIERNMKLQQNLMTSTDDPLKTLGRQIAAVSYVLKHNCHALLTDLNMTSGPSAILQFILSYVIQLIKYYPNVEVNLLVLTVTVNVVQATTAFPRPSLHIIHSAQMTHAFKPSSNINSIKSFKVQISTELYIYKDSVRTAQ